MALFLSAELFKTIAPPKVLNDDGYDRLSRRYSVVVIGILLIVVTSSQLLGKPLNVISCWCPAEFTGEMIRYANSICWAKNTYYVPEDRHIPLRNEKRPAHISYYQWVPFILLAQIFLFYLPGFLWRNLNRYSFVDSKAIMSQIQRLDVVDNKRQDKVQSLVGQFHGALGHSRARNSRRRIWEGRRRILSRLRLPLGNTSGGFLVYIYFFIKLLYVANAIVQLFLLNRFLGYNYSSHGLSHLRSFLTALPGQRGNTSIDRFPLVTICEFGVRGLADQRRHYSVQCTLPINIFNDKIFLIIWYWLIFVSAASVYGLVSFFFSMTTGRRLNFVQRHLKVNRSLLCSACNGNGKLKRPDGSVIACDCNTEDDGEQLKIDKNELSFFAEEYCRPDGVFVLKLIQKNVDEVIVGEIITSLWKRYEDEANHFFSLRQHHAAAVERYYT